MMRRERGKHKQTNQPKPEIQKENCCYNQSQHHHQVLLQRREEKRREERDEKNLKKRKKDKKFLPGFCQRESMLKWVLQKSCTRIAQNFQKETHFYPMSSP
jgi:hypothetical protein